jgi:hypothetical protein
MAKNRIFHRSFIANFKLNVYEYVNNGALLWLRKSILAVLPLGNIYHDAGKSRWPHRGILKGRFFLSVGEGRRPCGAIGLGDCDHAGPSIAAKGSPWPARRCEHIFCA